MYFRLAPDPFGNTFGLFCSSRVQYALLGNVCLTFRLQRVQFVVASVDAEGFDLFVEGVEDLQFGVQEVVGDVNLVVVRVDEAPFGRAEMR